MISDSSKTPAPASRLLPLLAALVLVVSISLLAYAYLKGSVLGSLEQAQAHKEQERFEEALEDYRELTDYLQGSRLLKSRFQTEYSAALLSQLEILYRQGEHDEVISLADSAIQEGIDDSAAAYFWSGNAFFQKGADQEAGEDSYSWFNRAEANYRKALELDQDRRWGIRFNFELVKTVLDEAEKSQGKRRIKIMRPSEAMTGRPTKKVEG